MTPEQHRHLSGAGRATAAWVPEEPRASALWWIVPLLAFWGAVGVVVLG